MLEIRKGKSSKSYENHFFRAMADKLAHIFQENNWDGLLIGMPQCKIREDLQIDCLLITEQQIVLIDFKNYSGKVTLPTEQSFRYGQWMLQDGKMIKGGSAVNPYMQIGKQRKKFIQEVSRKLPRFCKNSVSTIVCFQHAIELIGQVPRQYEIGFSIADVTNYTERIIDFIDVMGGHRHNYLSEQNRKLFVETLFSAPLFELHDAHEHFEQVESKHVAINHVYKNDIQQFLLSDSRLLVITGNTKSGKTALIPSIRDVAFANQFTDVPVFAYSKRIRRKMLEGNPQLEEVESLFGTIYDFASETVDDTYKKLIPLRQQEELEEGEKTLYIIDDSQLITNTSFDKELLQFGTGKLLQDIFTHVDLANHPERKIIFIGDPNKLSYGSKLENALNVSYLTMMLQDEGVSSTVLELALPLNDKRSEIVNVCNTIAQSIQQERYNQLLIHQVDSIHICEDSDKKSLLIRAYEQPQANKVFVFSNEQAKDVNLWIKRSCLRNGDEANIGDQIIFNSTIYAYEANTSLLHAQDDSLSFIEPERVDNGLFGEIVQLERHLTIEEIVEVNEERITLKFIPCHVKLGNGTIIETLLFENYLLAEKGELSKQELIAYQIVLARCEKEIFEQEPFTSSIEFQQMLASGDYVKTVRQDEIVYRNPRDKRKRTPFENAYRQRLVKKLNNPNNEYFRLLNAARVKFGWALTVHKAMAYSFDNVFFNVKQSDTQGRTNKDYFKWLYTGISIATNEVQLLNWEPITPFLHTIFDLHITPVPYKAKGCLFTLSNHGEPAEQLRLFLQKQLAQVATILEMQSRNYLEMVTLQLEDRQLELNFHYNGKGEMQNPKLKRGSSLDFEKISNCLKADVYEIPVNLGEMKPYIEELAAILLKQQIQMSIAKYGEWEIILQLKKGIEQLTVQLWYNGEYMFSKFKYVSGDVSLFKEVVANIQNFYGLTQLGNVN